MEAVRAGGTAWRHVGAVRDRGVDGAVRRWTTRSGLELSTFDPRVVHGSGLVHPPPRKRLSTELSPDVGEVCAQSDATRPIRDGVVVTSAQPNRCFYPAATQVTRRVTGPSTVWITEPEVGAVSVEGHTTSGRVSRRLWKIVSCLRTVPVPVDNSRAGIPPRSAPRTPTPRLGKRARRG